MRADGVGLYVHVPFCLRKCNYCDFCSFPPEKVENRAGYIDRLCEEIRSYREKNLTLDSIFFGGGTPSLLTQSEFGKIVDAIEECFGISPLCEFTLEANPATLTEEKISFYLSRGVNRLSIGLQSIHKNELKKLGRIHSFSDFLESYNLARRCGIQNINVDLMYGIPEQTAESFRETLERITALLPEHISVYGLIIEDGTPFFNERDSLPLPDEDNECDMYFSAARILSGFGYSHYEISNYAKPGRECKHNLKYWRAEEYIGVGVSAYSYFDKRRYGNTKDIEKYICGTGSATDSVMLDGADLAYEYVMLHMRLGEGFLLSEYERIFGNSFTAGREEVIKKLADRGYVLISGDRISLTERGFYVSNYILTELI